MAYIVDRPEQNFKRNLPQFGNKLDPVELLPYLSCLTRMSMEKIKAVQRNDGAQCAVLELYQQLIRMPKWWEELIRALRTPEINQPELADLLDPQYNQKNTAGVKMAKIDCGPITADTLFRHLNESVLKALTALDNEEALKDWRVLASELDYTIGDVLNIQSQRKGSCTRYLLEDWMNKSRANLGTLLQALEFLEREDLICKIEEITNYKYPRIPQPKGEDEQNFDIQSHQENNGSVIPQPEGDDGKRDELIQSCQEICKDPRISQTGWENVEGTQPFIHQDTNSNGPHKNTDGHQNDEQSLDSSCSKESGTHKFLINVDLSNGVDLSHNGKGDQNDLKSKQCQQFSKSAPVQASVGTSQSHRIGLNCKSNTGIIIGHFDTADVRSNQSQSKIAVTADACSVSERIDQSKNEKIASAELCSLSLAQSEDRNSLVDTGADTSIKPCSQFSETGQFQSESLEKKAIEKSLKHLKSNISTQSQNADLLSCSKKEDSFQTGNDTEDLNWSEGEMTPKLNDNTESSTQITMQNISEAPVYTNNVNSWSTSENNENQTLNSLKDEHGNVNYQKQIENEKNLKDKIIDKINNNSSFRYTGTVCIGLASISALALLVVKRF